MKRRLRILPWLGLAMAMFLGGQWVQAAETGDATAVPTAQVETAAPGSAAPTAQIETATPDSAAPTIQIDQTTLNNGGTIKVTGKAPAGKPVYIEVWADGHDVRSSRFDSDVDKETKKRPYIFYLTAEMPAYYKILVPKDLQPKLDEAKKEGSKWSYSALLKDLGADIAYSVPAGVAIERYQSGLMASVVGSRGKLLPAMDEKESKKRSMQLVKARFRSIGRVIGASVEIQPDGSYAATLKIAKGSAPGQYKVVAVVDKKVKSEPAVFENKISFPTVYMDNAGTSMNLIYPFILSLCVAIFGVLMGAGGGFIMNPLLLTLFPVLPHTVVAGTVTPTVLFSQGSGIYNYSKIKFINWKLGAGIGCAMLLGGFIGPKLTEMVTLEQYKFAFGWILIVLAGLMFWQTTPGYLEKNKKEQAILKEFKKRAEEAAKGK